MKSRETIRVGAGAGTSDDRMVPALELAERGDIDYLVFECLAERTVSRKIWRAAKTRNSAIRRRCTRACAWCCRPASPRASASSATSARQSVGGARAARKEAADLGLGDVAVAVVLGDDVSSIVKHRPELNLIENGGRWNPFCLK